MIVKPNKTGGFGVYCDGQLVLEIDETSDRETINLFLTPIDSSAVIVETSPHNDVPWTHELLVERNDLSRKEFIANEPLYALTEERKEDNDLETTKTI